MPTPSEWGRKMDKLEAKLTAVHAAALDAARAKGYAQAIEDAAGVAIGGCSTSPGGGCCSRCHARIAAKIRALTPRVGCDTCDGKGEVCGCDLGAGGIHRDPCFEIEKCPQSKTCPDCGGA